MKKTALILLFLLQSCFAYAQGFGTLFPNKASKIKTDTTNFDNNLSSSDDTVQDALDTLDEVAGGGGSGDQITINGAGGNNFNFTDSSPSIPASGVGVKWQKDTASPVSVSAYVVTDDINIPLNDILNPDTNSALTFGSFTNIWTTTIGDNNFFTIDGSGTDFIVQGDGDVSTDDLDVTGNITVSGTVDGVDISSRDHDAVTLAGTPNYITLSGQEITRGTIDISDDTNLAVGIGINLTGDTITYDGTYNEISNPTANTEIEFAGFTNSWTSTGSSGTLFEIGNATNGALLDLDKSGTLTIGEGNVGCIMLVDTDQAGFTECFALNGSINCTTDADGVCDGS